MGKSFSTVFKTDAAAALGVVNRRGIGKMRNITTQELRMQKCKSESTQKIDEETNVADNLTKNVKADVRDEHTAPMRFNTKDTVQQGSQRSSEKQISAVSSGGVRCTPEAAAAAAEGAAAMMEMSHRPRDGGGGGPLPGVRDVHGRVGRETR